jgi:hypothetical protein
MKLLVYGSKFSETAATVNMHASTYMIMTNTCMYRNLYIIIQVLPEHGNLHNKTDYIQNEQPSVDLSPCYHLSENCKSL